MTPAELLGWIAPTFSFIPVWFYGNGGKKGPILGLCAQLPWFALAYTSGLTGLAVSACGYTAIHLRNLWKAG